MIDKLKDILIIIGSIGLAVLTYILSEKNKKIGELYYQAKSEAYKTKIETLEVEHAAKTETAITTNTKYLDLKRKYEDAKRRSNV